MPLGAILAAMGAAQVDAEAIAAARLTGRAQVAGVRAILALRKLALAAAKAAIPYRHARKRAANDDLDPNSHDAWVLAMEEEERSAAERAPPSARADERLAVALAAGAAPSASPAESAARRRAPRAARGAPPPRRGRRRRRRLRLWAGAHCRS
jgi:hypothetical protein